MPDAYDRRARLAPVYITAFPLLPLAATAVAALPGWYKLVSLSWFAVPYLLEEFARDRGKRLQLALWESWGGGRAKHHLRWRSTTNEHIMSARHADVEELLADGTELPDRNEELANPEESDFRYDAAVEKLLVLAQEDEHVLLAENARYGLRRNLWGMKPAGVSISLAGVLGCALFVLFGAQGSRTAFIVVGVINVLLLAFWLIIVRPDWVKRQADNYAIELYKSTRRKVRKQSAPSPEDSGE